MNKFIKFAGALISGLVIYLFFLAFLPSTHGWQQREEEGFVEDRKQTSETPVQFAVIGDYGSGLEQAEQVAEMIKGWDIDLIITTGDNYYAAAGGSGGNGMDQLDNSVGSIYCPFLKDTGLPNSGNVDCPRDMQSKGLNRFFPSIGNHERTNLKNGIADYLNYFNLPGQGFDNSSGEERYYDFVQGPVHFFAIDSDSALQQAADMRAQKAWLEDALAKSTARWQVVYFHHAAFSSGRHGSRATMQWPFAEWGADVVFQGHDHAYERINRDGIVYIVSGYGGKSLYDFGRPVDGSMVRYNENYGAVKVIATDETLVIEGWSLLQGRGPDSVDTGMIIDSFSVSDDRREECFSFFSAIGGNENDALEIAETGVVDVNSVDLDLGSFDGSRQIVGFRFNDIPLREGGHIKRAFLEFTARYDGHDQPDLSIYGQDVDNALPFKEENFNISDRPPTNEVVNWNDVSPWSRGLPRNKYYSVDLTPIIQEIIDRPGWQEDNSLALIVEDVGSGSGSRTAYAFEHGTEDPTRLIVDYCETNPSAVDFNESLQGGLVVAPLWGAVGLLFALFGLGYFITVFSKK